MSPVSKHDVAVAIRILNHLVKVGKNECHGQVPFAVRGGGHAPLAGTANTDRGVTIDMRGLKDISVHEDHTITSVGAGAIWTDVYLWWTRFGCWGGWTDNRGYAGPGPLPPIAYT